MSSFEGNEFAVQVIAKGAFVDSGSGRVFMLEAIAIRLNHVAYREWQGFIVWNSRDTYDTDDEWERYKVEKEAKREVWEAKIKSALHLEDAEGSVCITQSQSEIFTVVHIYKIFEPADETTKVLIDKGNKNLCYFFAGRDQRDMWNKDYTRGPLGPQEAEPDPHKYAYATISWRPFEGKWLLRDYAVSAATDRFYSSFAKARDALMQTAHCRGMNGLDLMHTMEERGNNI
jgi:hypothetical protein